MRKLKVSIFAIATAGLFIIACSKKKDSATPSTPTPSPAAAVQTTIAGSTNTSGPNVTSHDWKATKVVVGGFDVTKQFFPSCQLDNIYTLKSDFTCIMDEGATKCDTSSPQRQPGNWGLVNDGKVFFIKTQDADTLSGTIVSSTSTSMTINSNYASVNANITFDRLK
jgi:hypothetical protein